MILKRQQVAMTHLKKSETGLENHLWSYQLEPKVYKVLQKWIEVQQKLWKAQVQVTRYAKKRTL